MEQWKNNARREPIIVDLDTLVPKDHLLRKIEKVMDYDWLYERLDPLYCHDNGRPGTDPVVLIKMVLIQHLFGIPSLRQTYREIQVNLAYRWFLGYGLLDEIPHFATVSYAFCKRFPEELTCEIFEHILNKALNNRMVDPSVVFIDGTHIKASANKKKYQKQKVAEAAKIYAGKLREEVNAERRELGKKPIEDGDDDDDPKPPKGGKPKEKTVSTTDPDCGMFVKGEHERQFAYEAHTACDKNGFILGVEVTAGNVHDSVAWDKVYDEVTAKHDVKFVTMDAGYKTPWIAKKTFDDGRIPILPYTRPTRKRTGYKPWDYTYDPVKDQFICPQGQILRHTTTDRDGKRTYRSTPKNCTACPCKSWCGANEKGQKLLTTHIWQEYLDLAEEVRKNEYARMLYRQRKESIERVFADAKEKHAMRYTHHRGLAAVTRWVRLKFAAMNLKKLANWSWKNSLFLFIGIHFPHFYDKTPVFLKRKQGFFDRLKQPEADGFGLFFVGGAVIDRLTAVLFAPAPQITGRSMIAPTGAYQCRGGALTRPVMPTASEKPPRCGGGRFMNRPYGFDVPCRTKRVLLDCRQAQGTTVWVRALPGNAKSAVGMTADYCKKGEEK